MRTSLAAIKALQGAIYVATYNKDWSYLVEITLDLEKKDEINQAHVSSVVGTMMSERAPISNLRRLIDKSNLVDASEKAGSEERDSIFVTALKANTDAEIVELLHGTIQDSDFDILKPFLVDPSPQVSLATLKILLTHHSVATGRIELLKMIQYIDNDNELVDKIILLMRVYRTGSVEPSEEFDKYFLHHFLCLEFCREDHLGISKFTTILREGVKKYPECCRHYFEDMFLPVHFVCVAQVCAPQILLGLRNNSRRIEAMNLLVEEYPESAFVPYDKDGAAPIHYLIQRRGFSPLIDKVLDTVLLDRPCPNTGLFPAQHAAMGVVPGENFHLECIYRLLRKDPMVVLSGTTGAGAFLLDDPDYLELCRKDRELSRIHYEHYVKLTKMERKRKLQMEAIEKECKRQMEAIEMERKRKVEAIETERKLLRARVESKQT